MRRYLLVVFVVLTVFLAGCLGPGAEVPGLDEESPETAPDGDSEPGTVNGVVEFHHIDVGQADATLVVTPADETILIDTGDWRQDGQEVIAYLEAEGIERIDHLVATHAHADHIGGHAAIIEHFETEHDGIGAAYDSGVPHTTQTYENYLDAVDSFAVDLFEVQAGDELPIDSPGVNATVLNPPAGDSGGDLHYNSVALTIDVGDVRYLTTGDAEADAEQRLVEEWAAKLDADVYQAGHHGSSTSSTPPFLDAVAPEIAIISSGFDSRYGHPHDEVLEAFDERGVSTYWTGVHGDVVVTTDGESIDVTTAVDFSTDPTDLREEKPTESTDRLVPTEITVLLPG